jgi:diguanylate cyclase (GGDEF)-like protein
VSAAGLVADARPDLARRLSPRELRVELVLAGVVVGAGAAVAALVASDRPAAVGVLALCVLAYAVATRVPLYAGAGCALPTQLAFVPMLFLLPLPAVPLAVVAGCCLGATVDVLPGRERPEHLITAVADAGYALAPVAVLVAFGEPAPGDHGWPALGAALAAQCTLDALLSVSREWLGRRIRPAVQLSVMGTVYGVDALLAPIGFLVAAYAATRPVAVVLALPPIVLLAAVARDRNRHLGAALERRSDVESERERVREAFDRVGGALEARLDRRGMLDVALATAIDAVGADAGRASIETVDGCCTVAIGADAGDGSAAMLASAEAAAAEAGAPVALHRDGWSATSLPLRGGDGAAAGALSLTVRGRSFGSDAVEILTYLAVQTAASLESIELHERLRLQAATDELTGLSNHRRFQEVLEREVERARRTGLPLSLVLLDVDHFKRFNDDHGHQCGDRVLQAVGGVLSERCRAGDEPARYGGEELTVILPGTGVAGARTTAEDLRAAIAALELPGGSGDGVLRVTASFGVAELGADLPDRESLIAGADAALYAAKRAGRNRTEAHDPQSSSPRRMAAATADARSETSSFP